MPYLRVHAKNESNANRDLLHLEETPQPVLHLHSAVLVHLVLKLKSKVVAVQHLLLLLLRIFPIGKICVTSVLLIVGHVCRQEIPLPINAGGENFL